MGRLSGLKCYLAGAIDKCPLLGTEWRNEITPHLESLGVVVLDPMKKDKFLLEAAESDPEWRAKVSKLRAEHKWDEYSKEIKYNIVKIDYRLVDYADFLILYLDMDIFTCGSFFETFLANFLKRPVIVWCKQGKSAIPGWLFGTLPHQLFFGTLEEVIDYLKNVDQAEQVETYNRWIFLNFN